jgi:hypothetical protein
MRLDDYEWEEKLREDERRFARFRMQGLSVRAAHGLAFAELETREAILEAYKNKRLLKVRHIGVVTYSEIGKWLNEKETLCPYCKRPL